MWRALLLSVLVALAPRPAAARLIDVIAPDASLCDAAIAAASASHALPDGLLHAVGVVESGRPDPATGAIAPWPWTIDVDGQGHVYATEAQAIAAVRGFQAAGHVSIDVGCLQVNLHQHPTAFASLAAAFDPVTNAVYAADFLAQLRAQSATWLDAAGLYHSATPALATAYKVKIAQAWGGAAGTPFAPTLLAFAAPPARPLSPFADAIPHLVRTITAPRLGFAGPTGRGLAAYRAAPVYRRG